MTYAPAMVLAVVGFLIILRHRQAVLLFMGVELLITAANWMALLAMTTNPSGPHTAIVVVFSIALAAAEATMGLSLVLRFAHRHRTTDVRAFEALNDKEE
ncbi:MAG: NADH-quinone oxidoreductase subunit K [Sulfobacillus thermosulfidooxidans]|uniref:NADH-ubiquinone oxidoreductase subunit 4L n=1 Tax=Sulfobacillus thermotolerans TaxID=338644 RepID=A0ABM6RP58_9FIRM|nr:NADH-quinone oxidoreductase subunit K [Sulfobacillus sp. hq2]AUW93133.1 NADH-ubiquinone oxidoreductase subunit 4L [Sulfobacillus thermotolerans]POB10066.1 NADH-ubiquinone oxidoreductase subunit 4L [Sulfobacillus sp. hq2]PSR36743.1 MAG: NADH-quinone oxidoreductase subunit K [Sulfobacillus thermosulfidooxidans]